MFRQSDSNPNTISTHIRSRVMEDLSRAITVSNRNLAQEYNIQPNLLKTTEQVKQLAKNTEKSMFTYNGHSFDDYIETQLTFLTFFLDKNLSRDAVLFRFLLNTDITDVYIEPDSASMLFSDLFYSNGDPILKQQFISNITKQIYQKLPQAKQDYLHGQNYVYSTSLQYVIPESLREHMKEYRDVQIELIISHLTPNRSVSPSPHSSLYREITENMFISPPRSPVAHRPADISGAPHLSPEVLKQLSRHLSPELLKQLSPDVIEQLSQHASPSNSPHASSHHSSVHGTPAPLSHHSSVHGTQPPSHHSPIHVSSPYQVSPDALSLALSQALAQQTALSPQLSPQLPSNQSESSDESDTESEHSVHSESSDSDSDIDINLDDDIKSTTSSTSLIEAINAIKSKSKAKGTPLTDSEMNIICNYCKKNPFDHSYKTILKQQDEYVLRHFCGVKCMEKWKPKNDV